MTSFWDIIRIPFGYLLDFLYQFTGNYGLAIILFALIVKLILLPASIKSKKSSMKMARLSPQLKALEKKYGDDKAKMQQAQMQLYREEGVSMGGGCLWSFLPLLILIPLYQVIRDPMTYMMHIPADVSKLIVEKLTEMGVNLGSMVYYQPMVAASVLPEYLDQLRGMIPELANVEVQMINYSFLGVNLSTVPSWKVWTAQSAAEIGLFVIPLLSGVANWFSMWISQKTNASVSTNEKGEKSAVADSAMGSMKSMMYTMPLVSIWIGFSMPAGMSIYWIAQALLGVAQDAVLTKHFRKVYDAEDKIKQERAAELAAIEAEKERQRAERRAKGEIVDNTSKKKLKAREKAERAPSVTGKLTPEEREALKAQRAAASPTGDPNRPHGKGRAYVANRYAKDGTELVGEEPAEVVDDYIEPEEAIEIVDDYAEETEAEGIEAAELENEAEESTEE